MVFGFGCFISIDQQISSNMDISGVRNKSDGQRVQAMDEKDAGNEVLNENHETSLVSAGSGLSRLAYALLTASAEQESSNMDVSVARNKSDGQVDQAMEEKDAGNEVLTENQDTSLVSAESGLSGLACALPTVSSEREASNMDVSVARNKSDGQLAQAMEEMDAGNEVLNENRDTSLVSAGSGLSGLACGLPTVSTEREASNMDVSDARNKSDGQVDQAMGEKDAGNEVLNENQDTSLVSAGSGLSGLACGLPTVSTEREASNMDVSGARNKSDGQLAQAMEEKNAGNEVLNEKHDTSLVSAGSGLSGLACALPTASAEREPSNMDVSGARNKSVGQLAKTMEENDARNEVLNENHDTSLVSAESDLSGLACALPTASDERERPTITNITNDRGPAFVHVKNSPITVNNVETTKNQWANGFLTLLSRIGLQHNTHVWNNTQLTVKVVLTDHADGRVTQILTPDKVYLFPTGLGRVAVAVHRRNPDGTFCQTPEAEIADNSDHNFILEETDGTLTFYPAEYGRIHERETTVREHTREVVDIWEGVVMTLQNIWSNIPK